MSLLVSQTGSVNDLTIVTSQIFYTAGAMNQLHRRSVCAPVTNGAELDEHLLFLEPLIGTNWTGGYVGEDPPDLQIVLHCESILGGKAVKYSREAAAVDFANETHFYWSPDRDKVLFLSLNNRGIVGKGVVELQGESIVLRGESHGSDGSVEFKTIMSVDATGQLKDTFSRKKNGEWVQGHYQEFELVE